MYILFRYYLDKNKLPRTEACQAFLAKYEVEHGQTTGKITSCMHILVDNYTLLLVVFLLCLAILYIIACGCVSFVSTLLVVCIP